MTDPLLAQGVGEGTDRRADLKRKTEEGPERGSSDLISGNKRVTVCVFFPGLEVMEHRLEHKVRGRCEVMVPRESPEVRKRVRQRRGWCWDI